ncbi:RteC domain-containing protein [Runella sp.]|uniref:RteC domain-containing protein n=1 Tax=Runella sp. TaxID=1960881 RepID=UPI003017B96E
MKTFTVFFQANTELFAYYRNSSTHLDSQIFHIGSTQLELLAQIMAAEQFELYLNERETSPDFLVKPTSSLIWTEKHVSFVEMVYAFHEAGSFNHGKVALSALADSLAEMFQVELAQDVSRIWLDVRSRKKAPDSYLQRLSTKLRERASR